MSRPGKKRDLTVTGHQATTDRRIHHLIYHPKRESATMIAMRLPGHIGISRVAPIAVLFILCLVTLLYPYQLTHLATGTVATTASMAEQALHNVGKPGDGHHAAGNYPGAALEETEAGNQLPVNAGYLTALLLVVFFGVLLSVLGNKYSWRRQRALQFTKLFEPSDEGSCPRKQEPSLLSVFIL